MVARLMRIKMENMKRVVIGLFLMLALSSHAFAIIRSPYPVKPAPPYRGQFIVIGDDSIVAPADSASGIKAKPAK
jgi:hypothetical protein